MLGSGKVLCKYVIDVSTQMKMCSRLQGLIQSSVRPEIPSILEYAVPAWANIPLYIEDRIESIQKRAQPVIFAGVPYDEAGPT